MNQEHLAAALQRARTVLERRPDMGLHDDAPAIARLESGTRVASRHPNGMEVVSDMPRELGGGGEQVTPGWLFRAGLASCAATCIAMNAAMQGIALESLEVEATSRSDTRGALGMVEQDGTSVCAASRDLQMKVRVRATGVTGDVLRALVESGLACSPVPTAVRKGSPLALHIDIDGT
jgi:uncharacterized OsmC-like protein